MPINTDDIILVGFHENVSDPEKHKLHAKHGSQLIDEIPQLNVHRIKVPPGQAKQKAKDYKKEPEVVFAEEQFEIRHTSVNDPYFVGGWQWNLTTTTKCDKAWAICDGDPGVVLAICDTGMELTHPDLKNKIIESIDLSGFSDGTGNDYYGHGTHVSGIAGADTDNGLFVAGAGNKCPLLNVKVLGDTGSGGTGSIANGIVWATDWGTAHGKKVVINLSLGSPFTSEALEVAVAYAWDHGALVCSAAGNNATDEPFYPASYPNVINVASTSILDNGRSEFSSYGPTVTLAAPGGNILSTYLGGSVNTLGGTSQSTPHVTGIAGLVWSRALDLGVTLTNADVRNILISTCDVLANNDGIGAGRVNSFRAVSAVVGAPIQTGVLSGKVVNSSGVGINQATVTIGLVGTLTDASGNFSFANLPAGSYIVSVGAPGYVQASQSATVTAGTTTQVSITLTAIVIPLPPPDTTPPTVKFLSPANGSTVSGNVMVTIQAADNVAVTQVQILKDGNVVSSSTSYSWNTNPKKEKGVHTFTAKAYDAAGNPASATLTVTAK